MSLSAGSTKKTSAIVCAVCGVKAKLIYSCKKCGEVRHYCASFECQADNWDRHQTSCNAKAGDSVVLEDTLIKHISGGLSWSRSRKISLSTEDIAQAVRSEPTSASTSLDLASSSTSSNQPQPQPQQQPSYHRPIHKSFSQPSELRASSPGESSDEYSSDSESTTSPTPTPSKRKITPLEALSEMPGEHEEANEEKEEEEEGAEDRLKRLGGKQWKSTPDLPSSSSSSSSPAVSDIPETDLPSRAHHPHKLSLDAERKGDPALQPLHHHQKQQHSRHSIDHVESSSSSGSLTQDKESKGGKGIMASIRLKLSRGGPRKPLGHTVSSLTLDGLRNPSSSSLSSPPLTPTNGDKRGPPGIGDFITSPSSSESGEGGLDPNKRNRSASLLSLADPSPIQQTQQPLGYKEGVLFAYFPQVSPLALSKSARPANSGSLGPLAIPPSPSTPVTPGPDTPKISHLPFSEVQKLATKHWLVLDEFFLYGYANSLQTDTPLAQLKLHGCHVVRDRSSPNCFVLEKRGHPLAYILPDGPEGQMEHQEWFRVLDDVCDFYNDPERGGMKPPSSSSSLLLTKSGVENGLFALELQKLTDEYEQRLSEDHPPTHASSSDPAVTSHTAASKGKPEALSGEPFPGSESDPAATSSDPSKDERGPFTVRRVSSLGSFSKPAKSAGDPAADGSGAAPGSPPHPNASLFELRKAMLDAQKNRQTVLMKQDSQNRLKIAQHKVGADALQVRTLSPKESEQYRAGSHLPRDQLSSRPMMVQEKQLVLSYNVSADGVIDHFMVTAGTIDLLVERLADEDHPDTTYNDTFLLCYRYLLTAPQFMEKLTTRFNVVPPPNPTEEQMQYYNKFASVIKVRVLGVIKKWIDSYWTDFENNEVAFTLLKNFIQQLLEDPDTSINNLAARLENIVKDKQRQEVFMRTVEAADADTEVLTSPGKRRHVEFTILDPKEFAHQLTLVDFERFAAIQPHEYVIRLWEGAGPQTKNLTQMINWSNRIAYFTATEICIQPDLKKRARLIESFIKVAKECRRVQNFNSLMAIISGLNNSSVRRLKKTWGLVNPKATKELQMLEDLMSGSHNFARYREALSKIQDEEGSGPCIPFLGLILRDLTFLNDGNPKKFKGGLYNFIKLRRVGEMVFALSPLQTTPYTFRTSRFSLAVQEYLRSPYCIINENTLYNCSLLCEPRIEGDGSTMRLLEKWSKESKSTKDKDKSQKAMIIAGIHPVQSMDVKE